MKTRLFLTSAASMVLLLSALSAALSWAEQERALTNSTVIELAKAGLSDDILISKIRSSSTAFDLSPEGLIHLRKSGVSNAVLSAMMAPGSALAPPASNRSSSSDNPTSYGVYLRGRGQLVKLAPKAVTHVIGIRVGATDRGSAVDGVAGTPEVSFPNNRIDYLMVYEPNLDVRRFVLARLRYVRNMQAHQFNLGTDPAFFTSVWGVPMTKVIEVNLWRRSSLANFEVAPVPGTPDLYKLIPSALLRGGNYLLHDSDLLHEHDIVFSYPGSARNGAGYYFSVEAPDLSEEAAP